MELLLILTYVAICVAVFKAFKIPLNKWSVPTAALGGFVLISLLMFTMNYNHPYSAISRQYFISTPIIPNVNGQVIEVAAVNNVPLKKGDLLFKIDPQPYINEVTIVEAEIEIAKEDVDRANTLATQNSISERQRSLAIAKLEQLQAQLKDAKYDLEQTTVEAPADGYVTQVSVRPGMRATSIPLQPLMIFIPKESNYYIAWFNQNSLLRLEEGNEAEIAFDGIPGKIFKGKVNHVITVMREGQIAPSGNLLSIKSSLVPGRVPVVIEIIDEEYKQYSHLVPGGAYAQTAIYSNHAVHVALIRRILLRMSSWFNYIYPLH